MKIPDNPFTTTSWAELSPTTHAGGTGVAIWRSLDHGRLCVRMVEYTRRYVADHWCDRGHVLLVVGSELETELRNGRRFVLSQGPSYLVSDFDDDAHRSSTRTGAKLVNVD